MKNNDDDFVVVVVVVICDFDNYSSQLKKGQFRFFSPELS